MSSWFVFSVFQVPQYQPLGPGEGVSYSFTVPKTRWLLPGMWKPIAWAQLQGTICSSRSGNSNNDLKKTDFKIDAKNLGCAIGSISNSYWGIKMGNCVEPGQGDTPSKVKSGFRLFKRKNHNGIKYTRLVQVKLYLDLLHPDISSIALLWYHSLFITLQKGAWGGKGKNWTRTGFSGFERTLW